MNKGQVFSLDTIIALTVLFFAIALLANSVESSQYSLNQELKFNQLKEKGVLALTALTSSPDFVCDASASTFNTTLLNCVDQTKFDAMVQADLGLPSNFKCNITLGSAAPTNSICNTNLPADKSVVALTQDVLVSSSLLTKKEWHECIYTPTCPLSTKTLSVRVWHS